MWGASGARRRGGGTHECGDKEGEGAEGKVGRPRCYRCLLLSDSTFWDPILEKYRIREKLGKHYSMRYIYYSITLVFRMRYFSRIGPLWRYL